MLKSLLATAVAGFLHALSFLLGAVIGVAAVLALATSARAEDLGNEPAPAPGQITVIVMGEGPKTDQAYILGAFDRGDSLVLELDACGTIVQMHIPMSMVNAEDPAIDEAGQAILDKYCGG